MQKSQQQNISKPIYIHQYPFRAVLPYKHKYETFAKSRWYNKPLLQTLVKQFKAYDEEYYKNAVEQGRITINGKKVGVNYTIKNGDKLDHQTIREQPPILDLEVQIIQDNEEYLVVNKPPSFTVHTGGGFHYNTLIKVLQIEKGYKNLYILHRLDRLTSGLIILGKSKQKPQIFHKQNQTEQMKKTYYARVGGNFQWNQRILCAQIQCLSHKDGIYKVTKQVYQNQMQKKQYENEKQKIQEIKSIEQAQVEDKQINDLEKIEKYKKVQNYQNKKQKYKENKNKEKMNNKKKGQENNPDLKWSKTLFKKVFYDQQSDSSLVQCYPISGRTHQIRVHLQFLGHPILNDIVYGGRFIGNNIIQHIKYLNQQKEIQINSAQLKDNQIHQKNGESKQMIKQDNINNCQIDQNHKKIVQKQQNSMIQNNYGQKRVKVDNQQKSSLANNNLENSQSRLNQQLQINKDKQIGQYIKKLKSQWDYQSKPWQICLHSYQYKLEGKIYRSTKPYWTNKHFYNNNK